MFNAVIFDLDGTLIDTIGDIAASMNTALSALGFPTLPTQTYRSLVGWGMKALARAALPPGARDDDTVERCHSEALRAYRAAPATYSIPYAGIPQLLAELSRRDLPCAVLSNKSDSLVAPVVDAVLGGHHFRFLRGERPGVPHKPDPTAALELAEAFGVEPRKVLYLGDSGVDMATAKAAGFFAVGAAWGFRDRAELLRDGADVIIERPLDLLAYL